MLNKLDLSKKFELVVQQEIKNYNDSLNNVLQAIRDIKIALETSEMVNRANFATLTTANLRYESELSQLKLSTQETLRRLENRINDQNIINERNGKILNDINIALPNIVGLKRIVDEKTANLWSAVLKSDKDSENRDKKLQVNIDDLFRTMRQEIAKSKKEILEMPTEASIVKRELEEKMACHTVDVAGIMREINVFKRECLISEKKIEHLYILLDRLKQEKVTKV